MLLTIAFAPLQAGPPAPLVAAHLEWGTGPGRAGHDHEIGEGIPTSFLVDAGGAVHVLDTTNLRILPSVREDGRHDAPVELPDEARAGGALLADFDLAPDGRYAILDRLAGKVILLGPGGKLLARFGMIVQGRELAFRPGGGVAVVDDGLPGVDLFDASGTFVGERREPGLSPFSSRAGELLGATLEGPFRAELFSVSTDGATTRTLASVEPRPGSELVEARVIGVDSGDRIHLQTTEVGAGGEAMTRIHRFTSRGEPAGMLELEATGETYLELPRFYRATPAGNVLTFHTGPSGYSVWKYLFR